jgi:hypothetical protein
MNGYEAFVLTEESRKALKLVFPPKHPTWIGHHITHRFPARKVSNLPYGQQTHGNFDVIGYAEDVGIEVFVVRVCGRTTRPDGGTYHLTWSLDRDQGRKPFHSNAVLAEKGFTLFVDPIRVYAAFDFVSQ